MSIKLRYGKMAVVVVITTLIWIWADLAVDERHSVSGATISIAKSIKPGLWVSFSDESSISLDDVVLKGPASKIAKVKRQLDSGTLVLEFFIDPEQEAVTGPGDHLINTMTVLRKSDQIRRLGLTVESCKPETLSVNVRELVKKSLDVRCLDEGANTLKAIVQPAQIEMLVPQGWSGEKLVADVSLTRGEIDQARLTAIEKTPYIVLPGGQIRQAATTVKIKMPPEEELLKDYNITPATLGIALSPTLQGEYDVEVTNLPELGVIAIRATPDAKRAYEQQPFPSMTLYILDGDKNKTGEQRREVVYNFPQEHVRSKEIELKQQPVEARFELIKLKPPSSTTGP